MHTLLDVVLVGVALAAAPVAVVDAPGDPLGSVVAPSSVDRSPAHPGTRASDNPRIMSSAALDTTLHGSHAVTPASVRKQQSLSLGITPLCEGWASASQFS